MTETNKKLKVLYMKENLIDLIGKLLNSTEPLIDIPGNLKTAEDIRKWHDSIIVQHEPGIAVSSIAEMIGCLIKSKDTDDLNQILIEFFDSHKKYKCKVK